jgi:hypothetical protein
MAQAPLTKYDVVHYKSDDCSFEDFAEFITKEYPARAALIGEFNLLLVVSTQRLSV